MLHKQRVFYQGCVHILIQMITANEAGIVNGARATSPVTTQSTILGFVNKFEQFSN